ncbi:MAG: RidA family protein [Novosphingobium sp.]|nr:RidA family protein [Novosphingobium sp.]
MKQALLPEGWARPSGYSNGIKARGTLVFTAGVVGWNAQEQFESDDFIDQLRQTLSNTREILAAAGAEPSDIVRMTWYVTDMDEYAGRLKEVGEVWREVLGRSYPCMACVGVTRLVEQRARIEIETTAVIEEAAS